MIESCGEKLFTTSTSQNDWKPDGKRMLDQVDNVCHLHAWLSLSEPRHGLDRELVVQVSHWTWFLAVQPSA